MYYEAQVGPPALPEAANLSTCLPPKTAREPWFYLPLADEK